MKNFAPEVFSLELCAKVSLKKNLLALFDFSLKKTSQEFRRMLQKVREFLRYVKTFEEIRRNEKKFTVLSYERPVLYEILSNSLLSAWVSAVNSGRLSKVLRSNEPKLSFQIENKIITFNLHHFVFLFLTVRDFLHLPVISVTLLFCLVVWA